MIVIIPPSAYESNLNRLTNQMWKLIPMRENAENWLMQLDAVITELLGLQEVYLIADERFLTLLTKLKGLKNNEIDFNVYRNTVFKCISLLRSVHL